MKKRKINKRVLLVALAFAVLASLFAVSASALTREELGVCECVIGQKESLNQHELDALEPIDDYYSKATLTCDDCGVTYIFKINRVFNLADYGSDHLDIWLEISDDAENNLISRIEFVDSNGDPQDGDMVGLTASDLIVIQPSDTPDTSMVGSMVSTMTQGVGGILVGVGNSIVGFFDNTVLDDNGNLTTFATWALAFLGLAFGLGVVKFITYLVKK